MANGLKFPVRPKNYAEMQMLSNPQSAGQPEAIPFTYYDTQSLASNWTTASFFATPQVDKTLGNIEQGGQMPADTYFQIWSFNLDFLIPAVDATGNGINDILQILYGARATMQFTIASKTYGPVPATFLHASGGVRATFAQAGTTDGATIYGQNEGPDGGWWTDGAVVLTPGQSFSVQLFGVAAALTASRYARITMAGVKYRPVR